MLYGSCFFSCQLSSLMIFISGLISGVHSTSTLSDSFVSSFAGVLLACCTIISMVLWCYCFSELTYYLIHPDAVTLCHRLCDTWLVATHMVLILSRCENIACNSLSRNVLPISSSRTPISLPRWGTIERILSQAPPIYRGEGLIFDLLRPPPLSEMNPTIIHVQRLG